MREIIPIPAEKAPELQKPGGRKKAAAYARVSTDREDQAKSAETQISHYENYLKSRPDWIFAGVYSDEGISGRDTGHRPGFKRMMEDALAGRMDIIITKSVSRFARNTVDSLTAIRELKAAGVEVFFEKENIRTLSGSGELLITIMSSLAQEESRSISESVTWGMRRSFAAGKAFVPFSRFLGYDRGGNGEFVINQKEAETVKRIYSLYLKGVSITGIAALLTEEGVPAPAGGSRWWPGTVRNILGNEKYAGDAILQKRYTADFLTKRMKVNNGEVPKYYVRDNHPPIIERGTFAAVQRRLAESSRRRQRAENA